MTMAVKIISRTFVVLIALLRSVAEAAAPAGTLETASQNPGYDEQEEADQLPAPARWGCQALGTVAFPVLRPLSGGSYDRYAWARNRPLCFTLLTQATMAIGGVVVESVGRPTTPEVFGAGSFDRFFRNALRSRSKHDNIFNSDVGGLLAPILASGSLLITASLGAGAEGYRDSLTRALPLLWFGIGGNSLSTAVFKKSFGREFAVAAPIFHVPMRGSLPLFYVVSALYVFTNAGLGLFAATIARNIAQLGLLAILMVVPLILLSGTWTPPEAMPAWMRVGTLILPMRHYVDVSYGILLKGAGLDLLWDSVLTMALLGGAVFGFGVWRFRRQFS